jgi:hypothetical protein
MTVTIVLILPDPTAGCCLVRVTELTLSLTISTTLESSTKTFSLPELFEGHVSLAYYISRAIH